MTSDGNVPMTVPRHVFPGALKTQLRLAMMFVLPVLPLGTARALAQAPQAPSDDVSVVERNINVIQAPPPITPPGDAIGAPRDQGFNDYASSIQPLGIQLGSAIIFPLLELQSVSDSNIFATQRGVSDVVFRLSPSARMILDTGRNRLTIQALADRLEYARNQNESRTDYRVIANNRYELLPETILVAEGSYRGTHLNRGEPESATDDLRPPRYTVAGGSLTLDRDLAKLRGGVGLNYTRTIFSDSETIGGGIKDNSGRNRNRYVISGRAQYQLTTGYSALMRVSYNKIDYVNTTDRLGFRRDSRGITATAGARVEITRIISAEVSAGYLYRNFKDPRYASTNSFTFRGVAIWSPSSLTAVELLGSRDVNETLSTGYSSFLTTSFSLQVDHQLLRQLALTVTLRKVTNAYQRATIAIAPRTDRFYGASLGARYTPGRLWYVQAGYDLAQRRSTARTEGSEFDRNRASLTIGIQL